jgi:hypothetical protein
MSKPNDNTPNGEESGEEFFTAAEREAIALAFARGRGEKGATSEELVKVIEQIREMKLCGTLAALILAGKAHCDLRDNELVIKRLDATGLA